MNFQKFMNSAALAADPLCGINTYKDTLNLATGACTRQIKKLVLTGEEDWSMPYTSIFRLALSGYLRESTNIIISTHYKGIAPVSTTDDIALNETALLLSSSGYNYYYIHDATTNINNFKAYLQQQYAAGTPVTMWYVLATATTETITVPSGLSGTVEGYLNQSGTPTPSVPIYPTANDAKAWYDISSHIMSTTWTSGSTYERDSGAWT